MDIQEIIALQKDKLKNQLDKQELAVGEITFINGQCQILSQSSSCFELIVADETNNESIEYRLDIVEDDMVIPSVNSENTGWDRNSYACLLQVENEMHLLDPREHEEHKKYTRKGMIRRVLKERMQKAEKAKYRIQWAENIYGDHILTNENGVRYKIFLRNFENETGYSNSMDARLNKLGTTKHIMYAFRALEENKLLFNKLDKTYPFIEIYCDPLNDYKISWYFPHSMPVEEQLLISRYFKKETFIEDHEVTNLLDFIGEAEEHPNICVRPEVVEK